MSKNYKFFFCGCDEGCALCNDDACPGCGKCHILVGEAERKAAETGESRILLFNTKDADMIGGEEFSAIEASLPEELRRPIWIYDFSPDEGPTDEEIEREMAYFMTTTIIDEVVYLLYRINENVVANALQWVVDEHGPELAVSLAIDHFGNYNLSKVKTKKVSGKELGEFIKFWLD